MNQHEVLDSVQGVLRGVFGNAGIEINEQTTADQVNEWTSLNHIKLIVALEEYFKVSFELGEVEEMRNIGELISLIQEKT